MGEVFSGRPVDAATEGAADADLGLARGGDDALQEALPRAWRGLARFEGRKFAALLAVPPATAPCSTRPPGRRRLAWPYPDAGLADSPAGPYARYEQREAIELAFVAALQHLPGNQRAALLLFEVLGFSAAEIATMMATSTTSVNSALARARKIVAEKVPSRTRQQTLRQIGDARLREIVTRYATALERGDAAALVALLTEDVTWSMPPLPHWYHGMEAVADFAVQVPLTRCPSWRHLPAARTASRPWRSTSATTAPARTSPSRSLC